MVWIRKHVRAWRIALLLLLLVSLLGPWVFDLINVPAQYECSAPNIRLDGDFCGVPLSGIRAFLLTGENVILISIGLLTGKFTFFDRSQELLRSLLLLLPLLPVFSMLLLILKPDNPRRPVFTIVPWILALGVGIFWSWNLGPKQFLASWGLWLYMGLVVCALILEVLILIKCEISDRGKTG